MRRSAVNIIDYIGEVSIIKIYNEDELVKDVKVLMDVEQNILVNINNYKVLYI